METESALLARILIFLLLSLSGPAVFAAPGSQVWDFEGDPLGAVKGSWRIEGTKQNGPLASWEIINKEFNGRPTKALALLKPNHTSESTFNLAWTNNTFRNGTLEVDFIALSGKVDQGGGVIWRAKDKDNYYIARYNPLEDNFRVYVVIDGDRKMLGSERVSLDEKAWHNLRVRHVKNKIEGFLDGKKLLDVEDKTLPESGGIGLWTKSDAATAFDNLKVTSEEK
jgi:hypothetical protein